MQVSLITSDLMIGTTVPLALASVSLRLFLGDGEGEGVTRVAMLIDWLREDLPDAPGEGVEVGVGNPYEENDFRSEVKRT